MRNRILVHWIAPSEKDTANTLASEQEIGKQLNLRRARDLLLPRLLSGHVAIGKELSHA